MLDCSPCPNKMNGSKILAWGLAQAYLRPSLATVSSLKMGRYGKHSQELLKKQFMCMQYQNSTHLSERVDNLLDRLLLEEATVDLQPLFFASTLDTTTTLLFGQSVYRLLTDFKYNAENREFSESFTMIQEDLAKRFRITPLNFLCNPPRFRRALCNSSSFCKK
jgi:hypothetical protein